MDDEISAFLESLSRMEGLDANDIEELRRAAQGGAEVEASLREEPKEQSAEFDPDIRAKIQLMNVPQRLKLAMFGNSVCRAILIMDSSRLVQLAALNNPLLTQGEIETFAKNPQMPEQVLRVIAGHRNWVKSYIVKMNLVTNPRTPQDIALKWLRYLRKSELRRIAKSKNLPQIVAITARKILAAQES